MLVLPVAVEVAPARAVRHPRRELRDGAGQVTGDGGAAALALLLAFFVLPFRAFALALAFFLPSPVDLRTLRTHGSTRSARRSTVAASSIAETRSGSVIFFGPAMPALMRSSSGWERKIDVYVAAVSGAAYFGACLLFQLVRNSWSIVCGCASKGVYAAVQALGSKLAHSKLARSGSDGSVSGARTGLLPELKYAMCWSSM